VALRFLSSYSQGISLFAILFVFGGLSGCDTAPSPTPLEKKANVNPYTNVTDSYSKAASSALEHARAHPSNTRKKQSAG
jgi:hypothetical protein